MIREGTNRTTIKQEIVIKTVTSPQYGKLTEIWQYCTSL
jgi:hypothetical protein